MEVGCIETQSEVKVFCNVREGNSSMSSTYCTLSLPRDTLTLSLAYGRGTARYAYHGTADGDCGVSFAKPPTPAEVGRWKCANAMSDGRIYGGFVVVNGTKGT